MHRLRVLSRIAKPNVRYNQSVKDIVAEPSAVDFTKLTRKWEDITVPVPWGTIAARWWGPRDQQPVVTIHGWQENSNSWDPFLNMVPEDMSFLTFDMPGNGLSSHFPGKTWYHSTEDVMAVRVLLKHFQFKKPVSFLCHSFSTGHVYVYAASYPEEVRKIIGIDFMKPLGITMSNWVKVGGARMDKVIDTFENLHRKEKPLEKHAMEYHLNTLKSISPEAAKYVLARSMEQSDKDPNLYRPSRDPRLATDFYYSFPNEFLLEIAKHIKCEFYAIRPTRPLLYESIKLAHQAEDILKKSAKKFELVEVEGTHHVHVDHPERIYDHVMRWLKSE